MVRQIHHTSDLPATSHPAQIMVSVKSYALDPRWFEANRIEVEKKQPGTATPPEDAPPISHIAYSIMKHGYTANPTHAFHEQPEWADEVHEGKITFMKANGGRSEQLWPVQTKTQYQFTTPDQALRVANFLNTIVNHNLLAEAFRAGHVRLFVTPLIWERYCKSEDERGELRKWWLGREGDTTDVGAKRQLTKKLCDGSIRLRAGVFGGVLYEGRLAGGGGMTNNNVCVQMYPVGDMRNVPLGTPQVGESTLNDNAGPVDIDGQPIPLDGRHIAIAIDAVPDNLYATGSDEERVAREDSNRAKRDAAAQHRFAAQKAKTTEKRARAKGKAARGTEGAPRDPSTRAPGMDAHDARVATFFAAGETARQEAITRVQKVWRGHKGRTKAARRREQVRRHDELMWEVGRPEREKEAARRAAAAKSRADQASTRPVALPSDLLARPQPGAKPGKDRTAVQSNEDAARAHADWVSPAHREGRRQEGEAKKASVAKKASTEREAAAKAAARADEIKKGKEAAERAARHPVPLQLGAFVEPTPAAPLGTLEDWSPPKAGAPPSAEQEDGRSVVSVATTTIPLPTPTHHAVKMGAERNLNRREAQWTIKHGDVKRGANGCVVHRGREGGVDLVTDARASKVITGYPARADKTA